MSNKQPIDLLRNSDDLFQDLFSELLKESHITIEFSSFYQDFQDDFYLAHKVESVNGCKSEGEYIHRLVQLTTLPLKRLIAIIAPFEDEIKLSYLNSIYLKIENLKNIVRESSYTEPDSEFGPEHTETFQTFSEINFIQDSVVQKMTQKDQFVYMYARNYPLMWLQSLDEVLKKIDFLINQIELNYNIVEPSIGLVKNKIKTALSVPQLAYLFRLLENNKLIIAPNKMDLFDIIADTFQTKGSDTISAASIKNKFDSPEHTAIEFWYSKFVDLRRSCQSDETKY